MNLGWGDLIGDVSDVPFTRDESRASMVADTLAWAVSHGIPLVDALTALPFYRDLRPLSRRWGGPIRVAGDLFLPLNPLSWLPSIRWSWRIGFMIDDLTKGVPLSAALEGNMGRYFPGYFLLGLAKAERDKRLDIALPALARQMRYPVFLLRQREVEMVLVFSRVAATLLVVLFAAVNVAPKFNYIFRDLAESPPPMLFGLIVEQGLIAAALLFLGMVVFHLLSKNPLIGEYLRAYFPLTIREHRRFAMGDLAHGMAVFLRQGEDMVSAAEWSRKASRSAWLVSRLDTFIEALRGGRNWADAWCDMGLGRPIDEWLIRNAAAREDPAAGFEQLARWMHEELQMSVKRVEKWLEPCCTLALGVVVGWLAIWVFKQLAGIVHSLS